MAQLGAGGGSALYSASLQRHEKRQQREMSTGNEENGGQARAASGIGARSAGDTGGAFVAAAFRRFRQLKSRKQ